MTRSLIVTTRSAQLDRARPSNNPARHTIGVRNALVVVLAVTSGATDALGFLALGSAFTSVMTGNMVLFGVAVAHGDLAALALTTVAVGSFVAGAGLGARVAGSPRHDDPVWPRPITVALWIELALFAVVAAAWWGLDSHPSRGYFLPLLAVNAAALGLQSSAIQRFGVSGMSTTYLTGTLTAVTIHLVTGRGLAAVRHPIGILTGLAAGAAVCAVLIQRQPALVPLIQLLTVGAVLAVVHMPRRSRSGSGGGA
jgi:uncharacterized membrane protein YoaK (UPF0700 family)